ncbi:hypothetical protein [Methylobacterium sp. V23]|uniref:hypothetical protein n=1 Tax=Methylobacterium sp. V23 TaxID=2044878 RepID=UPI0015E1AEE3|nr:hypothetical protein [Methylobacterium sp. V23]
MADLDHEHAQGVVLDRGDHANVADPVFPEVAEPRALQSFANDTRIVQWRARSRRKLRLRRAAARSTRASPRSAERSNSIRQTGARQQVIQGNGIPRAAADRREAHLGVLKILQVFQGFQVFENGVPGVIVLAPDCTPGRRLQAVFDLGRQAQSAHLCLHRIAGA